MKKRWDCHFVMFGRNVKSIKHKIKEEIID